MNHDAPIANQTVINATAGAHQGLPSQGQQKKGNQSLTLKKL